MFEDHLRQMEQRRDELMIPDFKPGLPWFNSLPLSFKKELKGKIVILDFWTYCCINCIHVLPELAELEKKYENAPVAFVGVHSAKFENEKDSENLRKAILRYDIKHPVVNDPELVMWRGLGVHSWPTIVVVGPQGNLLLSVSGEGNKDKLDLFIETCLNYYGKNEFSELPLPVKLEKEPDTTLSFPGKLAIDQENERLFISDSNHHRIVIATLTGKIIETIGSGKGFTDGNYTQAQFNRLQGIAYYDNKLYVADTENHALRLIDLVNKNVTTLAGNGFQGRDYRGGGKGKEQPLSTPWDVAIDPANKRVFVAMAGTHQIWLYDMTTGRIRNFSGSGAELNLNSKNLLKAAWAQPSGISLSDKELFVADSESSSIRAIDLEKNSTTTLVGGDNDDPYNLFSFGDKDGQQDRAKLQHPLGVIWIPFLRKVFVADTYNHRIKLLDPATQTIVSWAGSGKVGKQDGIGDNVGFHEPSGFAFWEKQKQLFIADTNNHLIRIADLQSGVVKTLELV